MKNPMEDYLEKGMSKSWIHDYLEVGKRYEFTFKEGSVEAMGGIVRKLDGWIVTLEDDGYICHFDAASVVIIYEEKQEEKLPDEL